MAREWSWDLGPDGVVKLVVDEQTVETVYRSGRIVARSPVGGSIDGHVVVLPPRAPTNDAFRDAAVPSRELVLRRDRGAWLAKLEGRDVPATSVPEPEEPPIVMSEGAKKRTSIMRIAMGVIAAFVVFAFVGAAVTAATKGALARWSIERASHNTALTKPWTSTDRTVTVMSPSDFESLEAGAIGVVIGRKGNAEMFLAMMIPNPRTTDLDAITRLAADAGLKKLPAGFETSKVGAPVAGDCNGQDGRVVTGTISGKESPLGLKLWLCASLRPGLTLGLRAPSIQVFAYVVPDVLEQRDKPTLLEMVKQTTFDDAAAATASNANIDPFGGAKYDAFNPTSNGGFVPPPVRTVYYPPPPTPRGAPRRR